MPSSSNDWWRRPGGLREVLLLALPLVVSMASWTLMQFTDRVFLLWYSSDAVAAALPAGMLSLTVICLPLGIATYASTFVAQYHGAGRHQRIALVVWQGVWIGIATVPLVLATNPLAPFLFAAVGHEPQIASLEAIGYQTLNWGAGATVISAALCAFHTGRGKVRTVMVVDSLAAGLNIVLDYAWIFGRFGFPEMGLEGACWATVVASWCRVGFYLVLWLRREIREAFQVIASCRFDKVLTRRLLLYGGPNGLQFLIDVAGFTVYLLLIGQIGPLELAASNLAFNVNGLAFMPVYGIGMATATLVGQRLGENRPDLAARSTWSAFILAAGLMLLVGSLYVLAPDFLLLAHGSNGDPAEFARLRGVTVTLLRFVAFYCLFDAMAIIFGSAIKGAGDTRFVLYTALVLSVVPVVLTWAGIHLWGLGLYWAWVAVTLWVCLLGVVFLLRFMQGKWQTMRVIEPLHNLAVDGGSLVDDAPLVEV